MVVNAVAPRNLECPVAGEVVEGEPRAVDEGIDALPRRYTTTAASRAGRPCRREPTPGPAARGVDFFPSILFSNQEPLEDWIIFFSKKKVVLYVAKKNWIIYC